MPDLWEALEASLTRSGRAMIDLNSSPPTEYSFFQLKSLINHLCTMLDEIDAADTPILAVYLENSIFAVAAILATLRSGFSYLPLDPRWPLSRLSDTLERFKPAALVYAAPGAPGAAPTAPPPVPDTCTLLRLTTEDLCPSQAQNLPETPRKRLLSPIAYVLTTSGSTGGPPLGVAGTASGALARCRWAERAFPWRSNDLVAFKTSLCFVDSVAEVLGPLLAGVPLLAIPYRISVDPGALAAALIEHGVTHITAVPSVWARLVPHLQQQQGLKLRHVVTSGAQLSWDLLAALQGALPRDCTILNLYGSTEVAGDCTAFDCTHLEPEESSSGAVPVGLPLSGAIVALAKINSDDEAEEIELLDPESGAEGEVVVGGWGLAAGYIAQPPQHRHRFVSLPLETLKTRCIRPEYPAGAQEWRWEDYVDSAGAVPMFRTGDRGRLDSQGRLCLLGRLDLQIKVDGVRVDIEEVEVVLERHPAVRAAVCQAWPRSGSLVLAAYVEWSGYGGNIDALNEYCAARLPAAAVPGSFQVLAALPRSAAGKLDRSALPPLSEPSSSVAKRQKTEPAPQLSEMAVAAVFAAALGHAEFEPTESLFACGGTSLTALEVAHRLKIDVEEVFATPTVRGLATGAGRAAAGQPIDAKAEDLGGIEPAAIVWRAKMEDCVDTAPLWDTEQRCWAASHGGTVACLDAATGATQWRISIAPEQPDPGLALLNNGTCLAVAANSGTVFFLDAATGQMVESAVEIDGGLRSGPFRDVWGDKPGLGLLWAAGHGKKLVAVAPPPGAGIRATFALPAAVSAGLTFGLEAENIPTVYVGGLDGTLIAVSIDPGPPMSLASQWEFQCGAPIFGAPAVVHSTQLSEKCGPLVVVGTAAGEVLAVRGGAGVWQKRLDAGPIFAAPVVLESLKTVILGSQGGYIVWISLEDGAELGRQRLPLGAAATALIPCRAGRGVAVTTSEGHVLMSDASDPGSAPTAGRKLPAPTFAAAPGPRPGTIAVGCRDDNLYLIDFDE